MHKNIIPPIGNWHFWVKYLVWSHGSVSMFFMMKVIIWYLVIDMMKVIIWYLVIDMMKVLIWYLVIDTPKVMSYDCNHPCHGILSLPRTGKHYLQSVVAEFCLPSHTSYDGAICMGQELVQQRLFLQSSSSSKCDWPQKNLCDGIWMCQRSHVKGLTQNWGLVCFTGFLV